MNFKVIKVISGNTIEVSPNWKWQDQNGSIVIINGYNVPQEGENGYQEAKNKLTNLILNKEIELKNPIRTTDGRLLCDVFFNNSNIADSFPEYK